MTRPTGQVLLSGYAKLPSNTAAQKMYDQLVVVANVDFESGIVLEVDCTMATDLGRRFVSTMMRGYDLNRGPEPLLDAITAKYYGHLKKALLTAVKEICQHYSDLRAGVAGH
ncbi:MAG: DUF3870 domain-containing protein [Oscillospiraceae bacterium]|nr:DUF3870 domain-containing protein [Oscillospiraceae bacterium]